MSNVTGDVAQYSPPLQHDNLYRGCPCFNLSKKEFRKLIKNKEIPEKISKYSQATGLNKLYMKSHDGAVTINFKKFKDLFNIK